MTVQYPTTAPAKALTTSEQRNLKALIENDYRRARHHLQVALAKRRETILEEAEELFPGSLIHAAQDALAVAMARTREVWAREFLAVAEAFPGLQVASRDWVSPEEDPVPELPAPRYYVGYPGKQQWVEERNMEAQKAFEEANSLLSAQELEAQRTVLVRGVGSQEALNVLLEIPAATDLFATRVQELEAAPEGRDD